VKGAIVLNFASRLFAAATVLSVASSHLASAQDAQDKPQGNAARGKQLYVADGCWSCHGYTGGGSAMTGPALVPMKLPLDAFKGQLRQPAAAMPPYAHDAFTDKDAADVFAYLRGIAAPSREAKDIPMLNE
jgi:mono/diheme cytochrome c family protein